MITEDYVSFETAKLLKEKGFQGECLSYYSEFVDNNKTLCRWRKTHSYVNVKNDAYTLVPTLQMAMKWLREVHDKSIEVRSQGLKWLNGLGWVTEIYDLKNQDEEYHNPFTQPSYEEACEAAIKYCLENLI